MEEVERIVSEIDAGRPSLDFEAPLRSFLDASVEDKVTETALATLAKLYFALGMAEKVSTLLKDSRPFFRKLPKARTAKIVRHLIDATSGNPVSYDLQVRLCEECIEWAIEEKRTFLRHRILSRLAQLHHLHGSYSRGLEVVNSVLPEVKKLNDKLLLVELHLIEAELYFAIRNFPKSRGAVTACRTNANSIHCPPLLQAAVDTTAGFLHAEEEDYDTAFSYFFEAFEAYNITKDPQLVKTLKYMLLCRVAAGKTADVERLTAEKSGPEYSHPSILYILELTKAQKERSLKMTEEANAKYINEVKNDPIMSVHIDRLYQKMLERNIQKSTEAYSRIDLAYIAHQVQLPAERIEKKACEMILEGKLNATMDQGSGVLVIRREIQDLGIHEKSLAILHQTAAVVDALHP